ncbi:tRNA (adenosine(37)-N6)-dimethylallyltransferase MiaA [Patescibacteria group bacterium]
MNDSKKSNICVLLGPTSSGKTSLGLDFCKDFNAEIISADSRQIYKHMDIGTGKQPINSSTIVEKKEKHWLVDNVRIWGYDLITPNDFFSVYDYVTFAREKIKDIKEENKKPIFIGGTGFYIDVLIGKVKTANIPPDLDLRAELEKYSLTELHRKLKITNPQNYEKVDINNKVRIIRSLEKALSKKTVSTKRHTPVQKENYLIIGLTAPREFLYKKVDHWLDYVWENGLLDEVSKLMESEYRNSPKLNGLVYKSVISKLKKELSEEDAKQKAKYDLHAYIRRQETYFKKMPVTEWFDISQDNYREKLYNRLNG